MLAGNEPVLVHNDGGAVGDVGTYYELRKTAIPNTEINHVPPHSTKPKGSSYSRGPAIRMVTDEHRALLSTSNTAEGKRHRMMQQDLIANGRADLANELEYDDMRRVAPGKYDAAIDLHQQKFPSCG